MWNWLITATFLLCGINSSEGLQCYSCFHSEVNGTTSKDLEKADFSGVKGHMSCKDGRVPDSKFLVTCKNSTDRLIRISCSKMDQKGKVNNTDYKLTFRGCFQSYLNLTGCEKKALKSVDNLAASPELRQVLKSVANFSRLTNTSASGKLCSCTSDRCNSSPVISVIGLHWMILLGLLITAYQ